MRAMRSAALSPGGAPPLGHTASPAALSWLAKATENDLSIASGSRPPSSSPCGVPPPSARPNGDTCAASAAAAAAAAASAAAAAERPARRAAGGPRRRPSGPRGPPARAVRPPASSSTESRTPRRLNAASTPCTVTSEGSGDTPSGRCARAASGPIRGSAGAAAGSVALPARPNQPRRPVAPLGRGLPGSGSDSGAAGSALPSHRATCRPSAASQSKEQLVILGCHCVAPPLLAGRCQDRHPNAACAGWPARHMANSMRRTPLSHAASHQVRKRPDESR